MTTFGGPFWPVLSDEASSLYTRLLNGGTATADDQPAKEKLLNLGLLREAGGDCITIDPSYVSARWQTEFLAGVTAVADALRPLSHAYENRASRSGVIECLQGSDAINARLSQILAAASVELLFCQPGGVRKPEILDETTDRDLAALRRGVPFRTIYHARAHAGQNMDTWVGMMEENGAQFRTLDEDFQRFFVIDARIAVVPGNGVLESRPEAVAYVVHDTGIARFLAGQFERDWARADPWVLPESAGLLSGREVRVLRALEDGCSHKGIAERLGVGERAVAETIAALKDRYQVTTLFALACAWKEDCAAH